MATTINNTASVTYGYGKSDTGVALSNTTSTSLIEEYSITATKISNNQEFRNGENITYQITVSNDGSSSLYNVTIVDNLGGETAPLAFVDGSATLNLGEGPSAVEPTLTSPLTFVLPSPLVSGASATITYIAKVGLSIAETVKEIINEATVSANSGTPAGETIEVSPNPSCTITRASYADLKITKDVSDTQIITGQQFSYFLTLLNSGNLEANGVIVTDTLPEGFAISSITVEVNGEITELTSDDYTIEPTTNTLTIPTGGTTIVVPPADESESGKAVITITGSIT